MNCKECKFWVDNEEGDIFNIMHPYDQDTFEEMKMPFQVRECAHPCITLFERNPNPNGVSLCDGSMYLAKMYTGPEYGCVNFEQLTDDGKRSTI